MKTVDNYFFDMLALVAARSTCPRRAVGAILVDGRHRVLSTGYNGVPSRFPHCTETPCAGIGDRPGDTRFCMAVHAEQNAIINCVDISAVVTAYISVTPCFVCAKMLCNLPNLQRIVCEDFYTDELALNLLNQWRGVLNVGRSEASR
jgi:dCMP deaminase